MAEETFLARLVVIRRNHERAIDAQFSAATVASMAARVEYEPVPASTWQRPFAISIASRIGCSFLVMRKRRAFAGCADSDHAGDATFDLPLDQFLEGGRVD